MNNLQIISIDTKAELYAPEQQKIKKASLGILQRSLSTSKILSEAYINKMHKRMYDNVWEWETESSSD